ncbi:hypothetical protein ACFFGH_34170 [Lysobacter korlensis]|uniref:Transmembrane protein n=1 Tax=Lysobacter korlensis TaxID=553636 RepID=A0ABV6S2E5_9GAMM
MSEVKAKVPTGLVSSGLAAIVCFATLVAISWSIARDLRLAVNLAPLFLAASVVVGAVAVPFRKRHKLIAAVIGAAGGGLSAVLMVAVATI